MPEALKGDAADRVGRVTIVDVARRAGVSKSTVSLVLSGSGLVAEATKLRVNEAMQALQQRHAARRDELEEIHCGE